MKSLSRKKYIMGLSYELDDLSLMEEFHEATKFYSGSTISVGLPRIIAYLTDQRAALETTCNRKSYRYSPKIALPTPASNTMSLEKCLTRRRTAQRYKGSPMSLDTLSAILYDAIAPTQEHSLSNEQNYVLKKRPYPSGGGLYPIEVYPILLNVADQPVLVTHYDPFTHSLNVIAESDREEILRVCNDVDNRLGASSVIFLFTSVMERTTVKYSMRGYRFALLEAGHIAQNLSLCAVSNGVGTLPWGGYADDEVAQLLKIDNVSEIVVHLLSTGEAIE